MKFPKIKELIDEPILFNIIIGVVLIILIGTLDYYWLKWSDKSDVLVEAHGLLFDVLLFGILFLIFNKIIERKQDIRRYQENIDDLKGWYETEATFKIVSNLKRLIKLNPEEINLSKCFLQNAYMYNLKLEGVVFSSSVLDEAVFQYSNLTDSKLVNSSISQTNFNYCDLSIADFSDVEGNDAKFKGAKLSGINLKKAKIEEGDFSFVELNPNRVEYDALKSDLIEKSYLTETDLENNIIRVNLEGAIMEYGTFNKSSFEKANFKGSLLNGAFFEKANMEGADFSKAELKKTTFDGAILNDAIFDTVELFQTSFKGAFLKNATLINSDFKNCDFTNAVFAKEDEQNLRSLGIDISVIKLE